MDKNLKTVNLLIDRYGYYAYLIRLNKSIRCECVNPSTKEPYDLCKKCLGTGYQIQISKIWMATREANDNESHIIQSFSVTPKVAYLKGLVDVHKDDLIVDSENVYMIFAFQHHRGCKGYQAFTRCICPDLKLNRMKFLKLFKEVLNEHLQNNKRK